MIYINGVSININSIQNYLNNSQLSEFENSLVNFIINWLNKTNSFEISTSGSTGTPKKINVPRELINYSATQTINFFQLKPNQNALVCLNPDFIAGKMMLARCLKADMNIYACEPTLNPFHFYPNTIFDFVALTPIQLEKWINDDEIKNHLIKLKTIILGGAPVNEKLKKIISKLNCAVYETYGMTETLSHIAVKNLKNETSFTVIHPDLVVAVNENNCLKIKGQITQNEWLQTNDVVELINTKSFNLKGRIDFIINSGGIKTNPEEIENLIISNLNLKHPIAISSIYNDRLGEMIVLVTTHSEDLNLNFEFLQKYTRPKKIIYIESLPQTNSGKIDRIKIKKLINSLS